MNGIGDRLWIASLEADAKQLDEMSDRLQKIILQSPNMSGDVKKKVTEQAAQRQKYAAEIRMLISMKS